MLTIIEDNSKRKRRRKSRLQREIKYKDTSGNRGK